MRDFLLDTQIIRYWYDKDCAEHSAVMANLESLRQQSESIDHKPKLLISVITRGEIEFGHRAQIKDQSIHNDARNKFVREQLPLALDITEDAVVSYGEIRMRLFNRFGGKKKTRPEQLVDPATSLHLQIQENDLWICAQAVAHGMILVTNDGMSAIREVSEGMNPPLLIQNWTKSGTAKIE